jgi:hypothetical protein
MDKISDRLIKLQQDFKELEQYVAVNQNKMINEASRTSKKAAEIDKSIALIAKTMGGDKEAIVEKFKTFTDMQRLLNANIIRSSTLTEVAHFMYRNAPEHALEAVMKIINLHYEPDEFWDRNKDKAVWEWAAMLYPQYAEKWKKDYAKFTFKSEDDANFERRL